MKRSFYIAVALLNLGTFSTRCWAEAAAAAATIGGIAGGAISAIGTWEAGVDCVEKLSSGGMNPGANLGGAGQAAIGAAATGAQGGVAQGAQAGVQQAVQQGAAATNTAGVAAAASPTRSIWKTCGTLPLHLLATVASLAGAMANNQADQATSGQEKPEGAAPAGGAPAGGAESGTAAMPTAPDLSGLAGTGANQFEETPFAKWNEEAAKDLCSQTPDVFLCKADPYAAIDDMKDNYLKAYDQGLLGGTGEGGLPEGETLDSVTSAFDKAKGQLSAMLANTTAFKKNNKIGAASAGANTSGVSGTQVTALKPGPAGPSNFPGKAYIENGLEMIDEATGRPLSLFQRATRRHQGTNGERFQMLAKMETLRQNALNYLHGKSPKPDLTLSQSEKAAAARVPASAPTASTPSPKH